MQNSVCYTVTVKLENGLHLVPCSRIVKAAMPFPCEIFIRKGEDCVSAKNMMDLMTLAAECGTQLELQAHGEQAQEAIDELVTLFESNFAIPDAERPNEQTPSDPAADSDQG